MSDMAGDAIDLYCVLLDEIDGPSVYDECHATLSSEEKDRAGQFVQERHRREYVLAHGLLRFALSGFKSPVAPPDWSFRRDRYGRPFVAGPETGSRAHFSLSHTDGCVACVISEFERIGVDVERVQQRGSLWDVASSYSAEEIAVLRGLAPDRFVDRFFDYWTLKEAYLKARGRGLSLPLDQFSIQISPGEIAISLAAGVRDDAAADWHFSTKSPSPNHRLAIADGSGVAGGLPIVARRWPLAR
jgi:4'-phosphopantetheinyl transferase